MPYSPEHKARTRARIVESARVLFNRRGFEAVTIDEIMAEAGLTRGGFYKHFATKDELYAESIRSYRDANPFSRHVATLRTKPDARALARMLAKIYLSDAVADDTDLHCALYALPSDVSRAGKEPREAYTETVRRMESVYRRALGDDPDAERKAKVLVTLAVGGAVLARTTNEPELARSLRRSARDAILSVLGGGELEAGVQDP